MADRLLELADGSDISDRYDNNRTGRTFREQEIQRLQEHMTEMQLAEYGSAAAPAAVAAAMEHQRDPVHLQEKEEQPLHREKKLQQLEFLSKVKRENDLRLEEFRRLEQQFEAAVAQRMMEDERLNNGLLEQRVQRAIELQREERLRDMMLVREEYLVPAVAQQMLERWVQRAIQLQREEEIRAFLDPHYEIDQRLIQQAEEAMGRHYTILYEDRRQMVTVRPGPNDDYDNGYEYDIFQGTYHKTPWQELDEIDEIF